MAVTFGGLTAEQWNELGRFLGPSPVVETVNGIRIPRNHYAADRWASIEDQLDRWINSSNSVLNLLLSPVRAFVHDILHPAFRVVDQAVGFAFDLISSLLGDAINVARDAGSAIRSAITWTLNAAEGLIAKAVADLTAVISFSSGVLRGLIDDARSDLTAAVSFSAGIARGLVDDARTVAAQGLSDLRSWATTAVNAARSDLSGLVNAAETVAAQGVADVRQWASDAFNTAEGFAQRAANDVRQWASDAFNVARAGVDDALHALRLDIIDPLVGDVEKLLGAAGKDFAGIMGVLYDAAEWLVFVTTHIIPDVKSLIQFAENLGGTSIDDLARTGAWIGVGGGL